MAIESWMPTHKKGDEAEAKKHTGATSNIFRGAQRAPFGKGEWGGAVAHEEVTVAHNEKTRERNLVTKYFKEAGGPDGSTLALSAFKLLKEAGVKHVPATYRQVGQTEILMTDYNRGDKVAVGGNRNEKAKNLRVTSVTNLSALLASMTEDIQRATDAGISVFTDSYFFIIPISGGDAEVDFVIGDFGGVGQLGKFDENKDWHEANVERAKIALQSFVFWHVVKPRQAEYDGQILKWAKNSDADALANAAMDRGA